MLVMAGQWDQRRTGEYLDLLAQIRMVPYRSSTRFCSYIRQTRTRIQHDTGVAFKELMNSYDLSTRSGMNSEIGTCSRGSAGIPQNSLISPLCKCNGCPSLSPTAPW